MNREALEALREKVEADEAGEREPFFACFDRENTEMAFLAHNGSIDAAKALHEALLPGWLVFNIDQDSRKNWYVTLCHISTGGAKPTPGGWAHTGDANPARAWLLAILSALLAEGGE